MGCEAVPLFYTDPSQRSSPGHLTLRMGHIHGYSRSCTHPLLRDEQHMETFHSFSMEAGEEKVGPLSPLFLKMTCTAQSCQNGWPSPKWMVREQNCPRSTPWEVLIEEHCPCILLVEGIRGTLPRQAQQEIPRSFIWGMTIPMGYAGGCLSYAPHRGLHWETTSQAMCCPDITSSGDPLVRQWSPRCLWQTRGCSPRKGAWTTPPAPPQSSSQGAASPRAIREGQDGGLSPEAPYRDHQPQRRCTGGITISPPN